MIVVLAEIAESVTANITPFYTLGRKLPATSHHESRRTETSNQESKTETSVSGNPEGPKQAPKSGPTQSVSTSAVLTTTEPNESNVNHNWYDFGQNYWFLATAIIRVRDANGTYVPLCALFDGGSQAPFIRADTAKALGLVTIPTNVNVSGVYGESRTLRKAAKIQFKALNEAYNGEFFAAVNPYFKDSHPTQRIEVEDWDIPKNIRLADPQFNIPKTVDILMNAQQAYELLLVGQIKLGPGKPLLQKTLLGWVVAGDTELKAPTPSPCVVSQLSVVDSTPLEQVVEKFWTLEDIPRFILEVDDIDNITIHCFSDASKDAYASAIYVRAQYKSGSVSARLLCSKTRVAPLKTVSLPRLELLGCLLSSELRDKIQGLLLFEIKATYFWSDAMIALTWIKSSPHKWNSFIATRVTRIQDLTQGLEWRHVPTDANPADIPSRGMLPSQLAESSLWFDGPEFLKLDDSEWPNRFVPVKDPPEQTPARRVLTNVMKEMDLVTSSKFHSWRPIQKVFRYVQKFVTTLKVKVEGRRLLSKDTPFSMGLVRSAGNSPPSLSSEELDNGLRTAVKIVQLSQFGDLFNEIRENKSSLGKKSSVARRLNFFIDPEGIIRVRGRLNNAPDLTYDTKNPMLLPPHHALTRSLFLHTHGQLMHAGQTLMLGTIFRRFWPLKAKELANQITSNYLRCRWIKPTLGEQQMGQLPEYRITPVSRAFTCTGVDYFGPVWISQPGRGTKRLKAYIAVFVCFTTKTVHMEIVDDLTTNGFLSALLRFISRRGTPKELYSDNGTNLIGARNILMSWHEMFNNIDHWEAVYEWCKNNDGIDWKTIPARSPHHGGLWERAVASAKHHLVRTIGEASLYRAEMETVVTMVEAILNSRPLVPVTLNPKDNCPLTPAHFLIGGPLKTICEPHVMDHNITHLERFKRLIALKQHFWHRWSHEYLHTLLNRHKWTEQHPNISVRTFVLLVDKNTKPLYWQWGRVIEIITANDGMVR